MPVLTAWSPDLIEWALGTDAPAIFIVSGARALSLAAAEDRYVEVMTAALESAERLNRKVSFVLRTDSALRSHYPLDSDVVVNAIESATNDRIDGVINVVAFPEAGRITVDGVQYVSEWEGAWTPIAETRFAREPQFQYRSSDLRAWIAEKSRGRFQASDVMHVDIRTVRNAPEAVAAQLVNARDAQPIVVDAITEEDLRCIGLAVSQALAAGKQFVYRVTAPVVRAFVGQPVHEALSVGDIAELREKTGVAAGHGLIVVGTPVPFTRRQVRALEHRRPIHSVAISVPALLDSRRDDHLADVIERVVEGLRTSNVVVRLSELQQESDAKGDFSIDARVAKAINEVVFQTAKSAHLSFVVARGGSIVGPVAQGLGVRSGMVRGPMLPGIVSLWEPLVGRIKGVPFAVYAGGVGDDEGLADVVDKLSGINPPDVARSVTPGTPHVAPSAAQRLAVIGLGSKGFGIAARLGEVFTVRAWDVDPIAREVAQAAGIDVAASARDAIDGAQVVLIAVHDENDLLESLDGSDGIRAQLAAGTTVCLLMAIGIDEARSVAASLAMKDVHVVDAPVSSGGELARRGQIACLVGGATVVVTQLMPVLEQIAATVIVAGEQVGDGQAMKAVNQLAAAVNLAGVAEALALANSLGLDSDATLRALSSGAASSFMAADRGPRMVQAASGIKPHLVNRLELTSDDLNVALGIAREYSVATPIGAATEQALLRARKVLDPDADDSEIALDR